MELRFFNTNESLCHFLNTLQSVDAYMRQQTRASLLRKMTCRLFGAKPLSEQFEPYRTNCSEISKKMHLKMSSVKWQMAAILTRSQCVKQVDAPEYTLKLLFNERMITPWHRNAYRITGPFVRESTGDRWIPLIMASNAELYCCLCC